MIKQIVATKDIKKLNTRSLFAYDEILSAKITGMPSVAKGNQELVDNWSAIIVDVKTNYSLVYKTVPVLRSGYHILNKIMHFGPLQKILTKRDGFWSWRTAETLKQSDIIREVNNEVLVNSNEFVPGSCTVFHIETEGSDAIVMNGVLVYSGAHNAN